MFHLGLSPFLLSSFRAKTGDFTLAYEGETTSAISYDTDASAIAATLGKLSTLANANVTTELVNCSTPEVACGWRVTFVGVYGDVEMLSADTDGLSGNTADVTIVEETKGKFAVELAGSPVTVIRVPLASPESSNSSANAGFSRLKIVASNAMWFMDSLTIMDEVSRQRSNSVAAVGRKMSDISWSGGTTKSMSLLALSEFPGLKTMEELANWSDVESIIRKNFLLTHHRRQRPVISYDLGALGKRVFPPEFTSVIGRRPERFFLRLPPSEELICSARPVVAVRVSYSETAACSPKCMFMKFYASGFVVRFLWFPTMLTPRRAQLGVEVCTKSWPVRRQILRCRHGMHTKTTGFQSR